MKFKISEKSARVIQVIETVTWREMARMRIRSMKFTSTDSDGDLLAKNDPFSQDDVHPASSRQ